MTTLLMMPPLDDDIRAWAERLRDDLPEMDVRLAEDDAEVRAALPEADASYGWVSPANLPLATRLRWLQNPFAGPFPGYYHDALIKHPVVITNPRGIYSDHIAHHILMFMLALSRGLPYWMEAQRRGRWERNARKRGYTNIAGSTVLINGVGGIGAETARLCSALGAKVVGVDPRPDGGEILRHGRCRIRLMVLGARHDPFSHSGGGGARPNRPAVAIDSDRPEVAEEGREGDLE